MRDELIAAEVEPISGKALQAARTLEQEGFRVLHVGTTISVEATESLWRSTFGCNFETVTKTVFRETGQTATYRRLANHDVGIPEALRTVIRSVAIVEPPEFFGSDDLTD